ncbi:MAG: FimB/Mfa2 family fimbrial subunit [Bacteroidales bacterium]|nr:FimB/Mfa2 family fimbrial subunit [Bacteroidales bacterium]
MKYKGNKKRQRAIYTVLPGLLFLFFTSCISDNYEGCDQEIYRTYTARFSIYINVEVAVDVEVGTKADDFPVQEAVAYLFDRNGIFLESIDSISANDIRQGRTYPLKHQDRDSLTLVVIGNGKGNQIVSDFQQGMSREEGLISLQKIQENIVFSPSDIFYGEKDIYFFGIYDDGVDTIQRIDITRRVGNVKITGKSLEKVYQEGLFTFAFKHKSESLDFYGNTRADNTGTNFVQYIPGVSSGQDITGQSVVSTKFFNTLESCENDTLILDIYKDSLLVDSHVLENDRIAANKSLNITLIGVGVGETASLRMEVSVGEWDTGVDQEIQW